MFSQLGPLFRTTLRQTQAADTRLEIRRDHDPDQGKHAQGHTEDDDASSLWEDSTTVSIAALRAFLIEFLTSRGIVTEAQAHAGELPTAYTPPALAPGNPIAAKAMKAYAQTTGTTAPTEPVPTALPAPPDAADPVSLPQTTEIQTMIRLIGDLDLLSAQGIQTLTIDKADTFVNALVMAVDRARAGG